ncbi:hypothetical protein [uncultured Winogradskyella sp.]|uniref:hypothetical protein n=1 Tax=uncultured Winogradskyella sp. TaxID=395353 RepID=UPI0030DB91E6|tara:strand:+ start:50344 stop:50973 length:630 start_codon:yes stop_codon:yes gene_type:complete
MKSRLHFGLLVVLLAFLGTYLEHNVVPNQQILVQFSKTDISLIDAKNTIAAIQLKLERNGATHIQIGKNHTGDLRITYYSNADVAHIKALLSSEQDFSIAYQQNQKNSDEPSNAQKDNVYKLNISEIQQGSTAHSDFDGIQVTEVNQKLDRFSASKVNTSGQFVRPNYKLSGATLSHNAVSFTGDAISAFSYKIPEVRAGPWLFGIIQF